MQNKKGWHFTEYSFEDLYDAYLSIIFEYRGKRYRLSCEGDKTLYEEATGQVLWHFESKEELYNGIVFGRPIKSVIDESDMKALL